MKPIRIAGAGLAGLSLANTLQRAGIETTLHEAHTLPRHRVCGEFICGKGADSLARQGLEFAIEGALKHRSVCWFHQGNRIFEAELPEPAYGISRYQTDMRLADAFRAAGGTLLEQSRMTKDAEEGIVICSGRQKTKSDWMGLKLHLENFKTTADLELHLGQDGYIGLSGIENGLTNVCALFKQRPNIRSHKTTLLLHYLRASGLDKLARRIAESTISPQSHVGVAGIQFSRIPDKNTSRLLLGDAYSVIPPFTGNGMSIAIESAEIAYPYILNYATHKLSWKAAVSSVRQECHKYFNTRLKVARTLHPWIAHPLRQKILTALGARNLLPFQLLYRLTH